jgi:Domain of unknown function (DUF4178)
MFDFFKKKKKEEPTEPHYNPTDIRLTDLRKGFMLEYDLQTWQAEEEFEYDWGNNVFSYEFKLVNGRDIRYLSLEEDRETLCTLLQPLRFIKLGLGVEKELLDTGKPPRSIIYEGKTYYRERECPGFFRNIDNEEWAEFIAWEYADDSGKFVLEIEQWNESEFEAWIGEIVPERSFSNILPSR